MPRSFALILCRFAIPLLPCCSAAASEIFTLDGSFGVRDVSGDGTTVLLHDRLWTPRSGAMTMLPETMDGQGITADGSMVVGTIWHDPETGDPEAVRWTVGGESTSVGRFPPDIGAWGVSNDGSVVAGHLDSEWFVWTESSGLVPMETSTPTSINGSTASLVSGDGSAVVGQVWGDVFLEMPSQTFRWTEESGITFLGQLPNRPLAGYSDISADGDTIVGTAEAIWNATEPLPEAYRWTEETGMVGLGFLPGDERSFALAVSQDGSLVVGSSRDEPEDREIFAWTESTGMVSLTDILMAEVGIELSSGAVVSHMSDDQRTLAGFSLDESKVWAIELDRPLSELIVPITMGDFDRDGLLDADDIDLLTAVVSTGSNTTSFDLTDDALVNRSDQDFWIEELNGTSFGDADLDGDVGFSDFLRLSDNFGQPGGWGQGDFDFDGHVEFSDFLILAGNFSSDATAASSVPEPMSLHLTMLGIFAALGSRSRRRLSAEAFALAAKDRLCGVSDQCCRSHCKS